MNDRSHPTGHGLVTRWVFSHAHHVTRHMRSESARTPALFAQAHTNTIWQYDNPDLTQIWDRFNHCIGAARLFWLRGWCFSHQCWAHGTRCRALALLEETAVPVKPLNCVMIHMHTAHICITSAVWKKTTRCLRLSCVAQVS